MTFLNRLSMVAFLSAATFLFSSCNPDEEDTTPQNPTPTPPADWWDPHYVKFTFDGNNYNYVHDGVIVSAGVTSSHNFPSDQTESAILSHGYSISKNEPSLTDYGITIYRVHSTEPGGWLLDDPDFDALFPSTFPNNIPYAVATQSYPTGIEINVWRMESNGDYVEYSTRNLPGTQTGSNFTVLNRRPFDFWDDHSMILKVTFNCKLYSETGAMLELTNGEGVISLENF